MDDYLDVVILYILSFLSLELVGGWFGFFAGTVSVIIMIIRTIYIHQRNKRDKAKGKEEQARTSTKNRGTQVKDENTREAAQGEGRWSVENSLFRMILNNYFNAHLCG